MRARPSYMYVQREKATQECLDGAILVDLTLFDADVGDLGSRLGWGLTDNWSIFELSDEKWRVFELIADM